MEDLLQARLCSEHFTCIGSFKTLSYEVTSLVSP